MKQTHDFFDLNDEKLRSSDEQLVNDIRSSYAQTVKNMPDPAASVALPKL